MEEINKEEISKNSEIKTDEIREESSSNVGSEKREFKPKAPRPPRNQNSEQNQENINSYNLNDFNSFDEAIIKIHRDNPGFIKDTHYTKIETIDANNYLKKQFQNDLEGYVNQPSSKGMHSLNQHWTHTVTQLVDDRVKDNDIAYAIKASIENNTDYHASAPKTKVSLS